MSDDVDIQHSAEIKVLFNKLSELILSSINSPKAANHMVVAIINWSAMMLASVILMIKAEPMLFVKKSMFLFQEQIRTHLIILAETLKKKEQGIIKTE